MKITIFTSNSLRHISLVNKLSSLGHKCYVVIENKSKEIYKKNNLKNKYFNYVSKSENKFFKGNNFYKKNSFFMSILWGEINKVEKISLVNFLKSDLYIIFGASYIKGWLAKFLIKKRAINIHMGISPFYRGSAWNFWAVFDGNPHLVGATIHYLGKGIDSGEILFHALPSKKYNNYFDLTMGSVLSAQKGLILKIQNKSINKIRPIPQKLNSLIRYSKIKDFNKNIIKKYFNKKMKYTSPSYKKSFFINPYFDK